MNDAQPTKAKAPFCWQDKRILRRIRQECEEASTALLVYTVLTEIASDSNADEFTTTHKWIADLAGTCEKTVQRRLADLRRIEAVHIDTPALKAPCRYRLLPFGNGVRTSSNEVRTFGLKTTPPRPILSPSSEESTINNQVHRSKSDVESDSIEALYRAYPRHVSRGQALKAIKAALKKTDFNTLLAAVEEYAKASTEKDPKYIPHPATWFNGERWMDETDSDSESATFTSPGYVLAPGESKP